MRVSHAVRELRHASCVGSLREAGEEESLLRRQPHSDTADVELLVDVMLAAQGPVDTAAAAVVTPRRSHTRSSCRAADDVVVVLPNSFSNAEARSPTAAAAAKRGKKRSHSTASGACSALLRSGCDALDYAARVAQANRCSHEYARQCRSECRTMERTMCAAVLMLLLRTYCNTFGPPRASWGAARAALYQGLYRTAAPVARGLRDAGGLGARCRELRGHIHARPVHHTHGRHTDRGGCGRGPLRNAGSHRACGISNGGIYACFVF
jgi:hypothetical protein